MGQTLGTSLQVTVFGQSHSKAIGCVIQGLPAGVPIRFNQLQAFMARRAPGKDGLVTPRREADLPEFLSGVTQIDDGLLMTCGAPVAIQIANTNVRPGDYRPYRRLPRPGHSDLTQLLRYGPAADLSGGGMNSGRLTAPLCCAGAIAIQLLGSLGIDIKAHLQQVGPIADESFCLIDATAAGQKTLARQMGSLDGATFPCLDQRMGKEMQELLAASAQDKETLPSLIQCVATGVPAGLGTPRQKSLDSLLAAALLALPGCKGFQMGEGFSYLSLTGSSANDQYTLDEQGAISFATNRCGGVLGGITTGAPLWFSCVFKPTPSHGKPQTTVDLACGEETCLEVKGRHDPCIGVRATPVVEALCALVLLDRIISENRLVALPAASADMPYEFQIRAVAP